MIRFRWLLAHQPSELDADLWDHRIDLHAWQSGAPGAPTTRRVANTAANLPPRSRVWRAQLHDAAWDEADYLLAAIADRLAVPDVKPVPRPADMRAEKEREERERARYERDVRRNVARYRERQQRRKGLR